MLTGRIFEDITGKQAKDFTTTSEIWDAVAASRPTNCSCKAYGSGLVSDRGGVFKLRDYDTDIDSHLKDL